MIKKFLKLSMFFFINYIDSIPYKKETKVIIHRENKSAVIEVSHKDSLIQHTIGTDIFEIIGSGLSVITENSSEIYFIENLSFFMIDTTKFVIELLCFEEDLELNLVTDFAIKLSSFGNNNKLRSLSVFSKGSISNKGEIFINGPVSIIFEDVSFINFDNENGKIVCLSEFNLVTKGKFKNEKGSIFAKSLNISAEIIFNVYGSLCANGNFISNVRNFNTYIQVGGLCLNADIVNNAYGLISGVFGDAWIVNKLDFSQYKGSFIGLDNSYGKIFGDNLKIEAENVRLDSCIILSNSSAILNCERIYSDDNFYFIASEINWTIISGKCNPKVSSKKLLINFKPNFNDFIFGEKSNFDLDSFIIIGNNDHFSKIEISGNIVSKLLRIIGCFIYGDVKLNVEYLNLVDKNTKIELSTLDHEIKEIHAKTSETKFIEKLKISNVFIYLNSDTDILCSSNSTIDNLTIVQDSKEIDKKLYLCGDINGNNLKFDTKKSIVSGCDISSFSADLNSLVVYAPSLELENGDIKIKNLKAFTSKDEVNISGALKQIENIFIKGAGVKINQELSVNFIEAECSVFSVSNDISAERVDIKTKNLILQNNSGKRLNIKLKNDSLIKTVDGNARNFELNSEKNLNLFINGNFNVLPGSKIEGNNLIIDPSKIHSNDILTLEIGSKGNLKVEGSEISSDKKIYQKAEEGGSVDYLCANQIEKSVEEDNGKNQSFYEKYILEKGCSFFEVEKNIQIPSGLSAPNIKFTGGDSTLEATRINGEISGNIDNLNIVDVVEVIKKDGEKIEGGRFTTTKKLVKSTEEKVKRVDESKIKNLKAQKKIYSRRQDSFIQEEAILNRQLNMKSRAAIKFLVQTAFSFCGIPEALLISESLFAQYTYSQFVENLASRLITTGINGKIGDENYLDDLFSKRAAIDLVIGALIQGAIGQIAGSDAIRQPGTNHFDKIKSSLSYIFTKENLKLNVAESIGDLILEYFHGDLDEADYKDVLISFGLSSFDHLISSFSKCFVNYIGNKYRIKNDGVRVDYWRHKGLHFVVGGVFQVLKLAPRLYFSNQDKKMIGSCLIAAGLGGGLGAVVSEMMAEAYFRRSFNKYLKNNNFSILDEDTIIVDKLEDFFVLDSKRDFLKTRSAFLGKLSTVVTGLLLNNIYSLNASYEAGTRAINHNFSLSFENLACVATKAKDVLYGGISGGKVRYVSIILPAATAGAEATCESSPLVGYWALAVGLVVFGCVVYKEVWNENGEIKEKIISKQTLILKDQLLLKQLLLLQKMLLLKKNNGQKDITIRIIDVFESQNSLSDLNNDNLICAGSEDNGLSNSNSADRILINDGLNNNEEFKFPVIPVSRDSNSALSLDDSTLSRIEKRCSSRKIAFSNITKGLAAILDTAIKETGLSIYDRGDIIRIEPKEVHVERFVSVHNESLRKLYEKDLAVVISLYKSNQYTLEEKIKKDKIMYNIMEGDKRVATITCRHNVSSTKNGITSICSKLEVNDYRFKRSSKVTYVSMEMVK